jgi:transposase
MKLKKLIASKMPSYELSGEIEADESYFGGVRKGKRGRGAAGKVAVFGLLKRGGKVFTAIIPNAKTETLLPIRDPSAHHPGASRARQHRLYRHLQILRCS